MAGEAHDRDTAEWTAQNPVSGAWLREHLKPSHPRLILTSEILETLRKKADQDGPVSLVYTRLRAQAEALLAEEPLTRTLVGRRLLYTSRLALGRTTTLGMVSLFERDARYLKRLETELQALCDFPDWNFTHFLDAAEMAVAVALPLDWCGEALSEETRSLARAALKEKALLPSLEGKYHKDWIEARHNWNLVCHGGLAVTALAVFEEEPELATRIIRRTVEKVPFGLEPYAPDGAYVEGPSYWFYATDYLSLSVSAFKSALGTDFGFVDAPGVRESALFSLVAAGPSGGFFNYFDAGTKGYLEFAHIGLLAWFARHAGLSLPGRVLERLPSVIEGESFPIDRFSACHLVNLADLPSEQERAPLPASWLARGPAPVGILLPDTKDGLYLAAKGGCAADNHGNMDAGSFILEWRRIRWGIDPGNQDYTALEAAIGVKALWDQSQESPRWDLLTKSNFGHSTLTVNGEKHLAAARARVVDEALESAQPAFTFDLTPLFGENIASAKRTFRRLSENALRIEDAIITNPNTRTLCWQLMTTAEVEVLEHGAVLRQDGEELGLSVRSPSTFEVRVVPLSPPPLSHDLDMPGLKRIEILVTPEAFEGEGGRIAVEFGAGPVLS